MKYPHYSIYENLYKRFFDKGVNYLIDEADVQTDDRVLDICGGNGRLTKELRKRCQNVSYLDQEKDMIPEDLDGWGIKIYNSSIEKFVESADIRYTKVFCEQAINYWLLSVDLEKFSNIFEKGGLFVFNTFSCKPPAKPMIKEYEIDNKSYIEISYLVNGEVYHIQVCEGYAPHFTTFDWISKEKYLQMLSPFFEVQVKDNGKSSLYICKRK